MSVPAHPASSPVIRRTTARAPESEFLVAAAWTVGLVGAVALPLGLLLAGGAGAYGAAAGLGLLAGLFGVSAVLHLVASALSARLWMAVTVAGLVARLLLYLAALRALADVPGISTLALGLTAAAGILVGQVLEMRALGRARGGAYAGQQAPTTMPSPAASPAASTTASKGADR